MVLIISENDQIIGADNEFLNNSTFEQLKENFPSMSIFLLQSEKDIFDFNYNDTLYTIRKHSIILENQNANLYYFSLKDNINNENIDTSKEINEANIETDTQIQNNLGFELTPKSEENNIDSHTNILETTDTNKTDVDFGLDNTLDNKENNELELNLGFDNNNSINENKDLTLPLDSTTIENNHNIELNLGFNDTSSDKKEIEINLDLESKETEKENTSELNIGFDDTSSDKKVEIDLGLEPKETEKDNSLELDIGFDDTSDKKEIEIDLGLESKEIEKDNTPELDIGFDDTSDKKEIEIDLGLESKEIEKDNSLELDIGFDDTSDKKEIEIDLGLESKEECFNISISEEEIEEDLKQASQDLGIDEATIQEFFNDFKKQLADEKEIFVSAINNKNYEEIHKSAHKLKGVALNLRLNKFGDLLKTIDELAKQTKSIDQIKTIIDNLYNTIEIPNESTLSINIELSDDEKQILLKSLIDFIESIKNEDLDKIKDELLNAYNLIPIEELKQIENIDSENILEFINNLEQNIKKELK